MKVYRRTAPRVHATTDGAPPTATAHRARPELRRLHEASERSSRSLEREGHAARGPSIGSTEGRNSPPWMRHRAAAHAAQAARRQAIRDRATLLAEFVASRGLDLPSHGVVDSVRVSLLQPLHGRDRRQLEEKGFVPVAGSARCKRGPNDQLFDIEPGAERYLRREDGCRLFVHERKLAVTASLPRILGLSNDRLHELSEADVVAALQAITHDLFPITTYKAQFGDRKWAVAEIALALDRETDVQRVLRGYELSKWPRTLSAPQRWTGGLAWAGTDNRLTVYDKGLEMRSRGCSGAPDPGTILRVERQWRGPETLARLAELLAPTGYRPERIRLVESCRNGVFAVPYYLDHRALHTALAYEIAQLDPPIEVFHTRRETIAGHMARCATFDAAMRATCDPKTYREYGKIKRLLDRASVIPDSLLNICYGSSRRTVAGYFLGSS